MLYMLKMENDPFFQAYSEEIDESQYGGALPYFVGKQYGNGWLRTVARIAFPIIKKLFGVAGNAAKEVIYNKTPVLDAVKDSAFKALGSYVTAKAAAATAPPPPSQSKGIHKRGRGFISASSINRGRKRPKVSFPIFNK